MKKATLKKILLSNLIGIFNAVICGISIPLIRMGDFNFPMIAQNDVPALKVMMVLGSTFLYLIQNLFTVNLLAFTLSKTKTKKRAIITVLFCSLLSGFIIAYIFLREYMFIGVSGTGWNKPGEIWITTLVYMIGFYFLIIRKMEEETNLPSTIEKENTSIT